MKETQKKTAPASQEPSPTLNHKTRQQSSVDAEIAELKRRLQLSEKALKQELNRRTRESRRTQQELKLALAESKKNQEIHRQKNNTLEAVIANEGGPVFSVDRKYCYTSFNKQHAEVMKNLYGVEIELGQNLLDYHTNPDDRLSAKKNIDRALRGETVSVELYAGEEMRFRRYFEIVHNPIRASNNKVVGVSVHAHDNTGRKKTESDLEQQNQKINEILSSIQDDFYVLDREWNFVYTNRQFTSKIGKEPADFLGKNIWEMFPKHIGTIFEENFRAAMEKRELRRFEIGGKYTDAWYSMTAFPSAEGITVLGTNITERKQAEAETQRLLAAVQAEKERLAALVNNISDEVWFADTDRQFTLANPAALQEFGIEPGNKIDVEKFAASLEVLRPDGSPRPVDETPPLRALKGENVRNQEEVVRLPTNGQLRYREVNASPVRDPNGRIIGSISIVRDITKRKKAEEELQKSEIRYRTLFNGMNEGFGLHEIICSEQGIPCDYRFLEVNPAFEALTGLKRADVEGKCKSQVEQLRGDDPKWIEIYGQVALTGEPVQFENYSPALHKYYDVFAYRPAPKQFAVIFMDITDRKRSENELQIARELSERRANELDAIFNAIGEAVIVYDANGRVQRANQSAVELFGFDPADEDLAGIAKALSTRSMDGRPLKPEQIPAALALKGETISRERFMVRDTRGQDVFIIASAAPLWVGNTIAGAVMAWTDVSERERLLLQIEQQRQQAEALARVAEMHRAEIETVFNALTDSIIVYGPDEVATRANAAAKTLLGFDPTGVDLTQNMVTAGTQGGPRKSVTARALRGEPLTEIEFDFTSPTGERRTVSASSIPMRDKQGLIIGAVTVSRDISARKQAEETRAWLASFPERNPNPVVEAEPDGKIRYANPTALRLFPELPRRSTGHAWLAEWDKVVGTLATGQANVLSRDVTIGKHSYQQAIFRDPQDGYIRIYGLDITDRKRAETEVQKARAELELRVQERTRQLAEANDELRIEMAERRQAEAQLRLQTSAMEAAANGIFITDNQGKILWCNPAFSQMTGYSCEEVIGWNPRFLKSGRHDKTFYNQMWQTLLNGQVWQSEMVNRRKDKSLYYEEQVITPVRDEQNQISHFIAVKQDVSKRKQAEEELRLANAYNRSLIEASLDPLVTITPEGKIGDVNKATEKVTGYTRTELIGTDFHSYFNDPEKARLGYQKVFETGTVRDYALEIRNKNGSITPVLYNASVYRDEAGEVLGVFAVARDITDRKQFETQLVQAEKHAVIGRMVGSITHEINNPLQTIKNCLYLIQQDVTPDNPIQEPLEMAASETLRITNLVGQLRELYRPKAGSQKASHEILDILEEAHSLLIPHLNNAKVQWQPLTGLQRCYINCVRDQILEVFLNISMNAIEAMHAHGGTLFVNMDVTEDHTAVIFRDTGPGIPNEMMEHLFEPFMTTKASGLGLGLSITYGIVQRHGGQIQVDNQPGHGASFSILLPLETQGGGEEEIQHANE